MIGFIKLDLTSPSRFLLARESKDATSTTRQHSLVQHSMSFSNSFWCFPFSQKLHYLPSSTKSSF